MTFKTAMDFVLTAAALWHFARGFWIDVVQGERDKSIYHIAWLGVFLAILAGRS